MASKHLSTTRDLRPQDVHPHQEAVDGIQYGSIVDSDGGTPSEDDFPNPYDPDAAQHVLGVSISEAQTHIADPKTPAAEKAAALEASGGYFGGDIIWESTDGPGEDEDDQNIPLGLVDRTTSPPERVPILPKLEDPNSQVSASPYNSSQHDTVTSTAREDLSLPSPWRAGPKQFQRSDISSGALRTSLRGVNQRQRSSSGPEGLRMNLSFNLPSMPKAPKFWHGPFKDKRPNEADKVRRNLATSEEDIGQYDGTWSSLRARTKLFGKSGTPADESASTILPATASRETPGSPHASDQEQSTASLHRTRSDESILLQRSLSGLSRASSLGDDNRFEHMTKQVNSRAKALRDSLQDTNFKMPSMPSMPSMPLISNFPVVSRSSLGLGSSQTDLRTEDREAPRSRGSRNFLRDNWPNGLSFSPSPNRKAQSDLRPKSPEKKPAAGTGQTSATTAAQTHFTRALEHLTGDIVILGGYRGSVLCSTEDPERRLWIPFKAGLNLQKVDLEVGLNVEDEETMPERVLAPKMLTHIGPVDISRRLFKRLRACDNAINGKLRVHNFGYDWRLSPHRLAQQLIRFLEQLPSNRPGVSGDDRGALVIAHSLGGLLTRHAVNQRPELFAGVLYAGVPQHCVNILGPLRNGDDVMFNSRILTAQVNFTIRTSFALLPLSGRCFVDKNTKEEYPVDFFDVNRWIEHRWSPCINTPLPPLSNSSNGPLSNVLSAFPPVAKALPDLPFINRKNPSSQKDGGKIRSPAQKAISTASSAAKSGEAARHAEGGAPKAGMAMQMGAHQTSTESDPSAAATTKTTVTIPRDKAIEYLKRTLAETKQFLQELEFNPTHAQNNAYPPFAVIYGKSEPTVTGAKVDGRDGIKRADVYNELIFASGDGVVLARAAQLPGGYKAVRGGVVSTDRGHVTLLTDHEAVGRCLNALIRARRNGVGLGNLGSGAGNTHHATA
jgi:pimeloyl-ACP methyl ester carboxylesterase